MANLINGTPPDRGIIDYVTSVAPPELRAELSELSGYRVESRD